MNLFNAMKKIADWLRPKKREKSPSPLIPQEEKVDVSITPTVEDEKEVDQAPLPSKPQEESGIFGYGPMIWVSSNHGMDRILRVCERYGWKHISPKVMNQSGLTRANDLRVVREIIETVKQRGYGPKVVPWVYINTVRSYEKGFAFGALCLSLDVTDAIVNAEVEFKSSNGAATAIEWLDGYRAATDRRVRIGLSTFALMGKHPEFPYSAFLSGENACSYFWPQCYGSNPVSQHASALSIVKARFPQVTVVPTFRAYLGDGIDSLEIVRRQISEIRDYLIPAFSWWHFDSTERHPVLCEDLDFSNNENL